MLGRLRRRRRRATLCTRAFDPRWKCHGGNQSCADAGPRRHEEGASGGRPRNAGARVWRGRRRDCAGASSRGDRVGRRDRVGRGWRGAGGAVHRRSCAGGCAEGGGGAGELIAREGNFSCWLLPRVSSDSAREKKHQNFRSELRRMQCRAIFFQRAQLCSLCWRRIQRAR
jgi:hypothetical protein